VISPARHAERELDAALAVLDGVKSQSNGGHRALCPAHDDHHPSLSIGVGESGQLLFFCFAGCDYADIRNAIKERQRPSDDDKREVAQRVVFLSWPGFTATCTERFTRESLRSREYQSWRSMTGSSSSSIRSRSFCTISV
jgi:hypothetical protein